MLPAFANPAGARMTSRERNLTEQAMIAYLASIDPSREASSARELGTITAALKAEGGWRDSEEWRISTWFEVSIEKVAPAQAGDGQELGKESYNVTVACDGQSMSCTCPSIEKAFAFYKLYCHLMVYQFYSIGPPWADNHVFAPRQSSG